MCFGFQCLHVSVGVLWCRIAFEEGCLKMVCWWGPTAWVLGFKMGSSHFAAVQD